MQVAALDAALVRAARADRAIAWLKAHRRLLVIAAVLAVAAAGFGALHGVLAEVRLKDVRGALHAIPPWRMALALALTGASYVALTFYDSLALRTIGVRLPWRTAALASFTSYTVSHNLGLSLLTGGSARYRVYSAAGLELPQIARIALLASATFWGGVFAVTGVALAIGARPLALGPVLLAPWLQQAAGLTILVAIAAIFLARWRGVERIGFGRFTLPVPPARIMALQILVAGFDLLAASAALFVLIPEASPAMFGIFFIAYALAIILALVTHVPGGIGVFEAAILAMVPGARSDVFAALLLYRLIYYLLPLASAGGLLVIIEAHRLRRTLASGLTILDRTSRALAPPLLSLTVATGGLILLVSGALPAVHSRIAWLRDVVPLPFVEASHLSASLVGTALLLVAPAINARLRSGFVLARLLLVGGALFSLFKGLDYEEALVLGSIAGVLQYCRPAFYRRGGVTDAPLARGWIVLAAIAVALSLWAGFFAYKHVEYADDLWWAFAWKGNAPRFLRASLGVVILLGSALVWRLLWAPARPRGVTVLPDDVADRALAETPRTDAALAFGGDKRFLISRAGDAFLMYQVQGRTWVVMGDPVGPIPAWSELVWRIREECDAARGRLCFYQAGEEMLPLLVELGLQVMKYGEEAHVDLAGFSLEGAFGRKLRASVRHAEASGLRFEIVPAADAPEHGPTLQAISDAWLRDKPGGEKGFSVGRFDPDYLARFDIVLLWEGERIVAFANIWATRNREELSLDMMRHLPDAPAGTMDFLFVRLMQWGAAHGYSRFNMGMAPLSGLSGQRLAPVWSRIGHAIYGHGEQFYRFSGLRAFKAKFRPDWVPRYVATPPGLSAPRAMIDLVALVGG
jgi:phosphatidylglycerol lysyltransferase